MSVLIFALIVLIVVAMLVWAVDLIPLSVPPFGNLVKLLVVMIGALLILHRAGLV